MRNFILLLVSFSCLNVLADTKNKEFRVNGWDDRSFEDARDIAIEKAKKKCEKLGQEYHAQRTSKWEYGEHDHDYSYRYSAHANFICIKGNESSNY